VIGSLFGHYRGLEALLRYSLQALNNYVLKIHPQIMGLGQFGADDRRTPIGLDFDKFFGREALDRPPRDRSAIGELLADSVLRQLGAGSSACSRIARRGAS
jgi:hypothetical protein